MIPGQTNQLVGPRSINLFITNLCNRACPFCYLNDWVTNDKKTAIHMSLNNLDTLIRWLKNSKIDRVKIAGGEPMLHPEIISIVTKLVKNGLILEGILTNGLGDSKDYKKIMDITDTNWLVNVARPDTYTRGEWQLLTENLSQLRWMNKDRSVKEQGFDTTSLRHLCLSITLYEPKQEYRYIIELAKKYGCPVVRYDVSRPSATKSNIFIDFKSLVEIKPLIMELVRSCVHEGVKPGLDDALPFCIFTQEELKYLFLFSNFNFVCTPHSDVMPDLTVENCTSMRGVLPSYKIPQHSAGQIFQETLIHTNKYREYMLPQCSNCINFSKSLCQGYCLRFKADFIKPEEKLESKKSTMIKWPQLRR